MSSYAIETKKRKFDRLLETLTDRVGQRSTATTDPASTAAATTITNPSQPTSRSDSIATRSSQQSSSPGPGTLRQELIAAAKRRRVTPVGSSSQDNKALTSQYLPSSRPAFLARLETFRHITKWHIPSTIAVNAAAWAKRGWTCADVDTVLCPSCSQRVVVDLSVDKTDKRGVRDHNTRGNDTEAEVESKIQERETGEDDSGGGDNDYASDEDDSSNNMLLYNALVKRYAEMIITSHTDDCPWKSRGCDVSIQRVENLLNTKHAISLVRNKCQEISKTIADIPNVQDLPEIEGLIKPNSQTLVQYKDGSNENLDILKLAICGWQYKDADVVECHNCYRSLGLWLYRGPQPTIENLDAVDSHLEYCPWRCSEAQDTETYVQARDGQKSKVRVRFPAWALLYHAIELEVAKNRQGMSHDWSSTRSGSEIGESLDVDNTSEQRTNKTRELMQRIKNLKKPFHAASLLRKKA